MKYPLRYYLQTFKGRRRNNEDYVLSEEIAPGVHFFAVADGMGGANAGEVASELAVKTILKHVKKELQGLSEVDRYNLKEILRIGFSRVQEEIAGVVAQDPELEGMGTTLSVLLIYRDVYVWASLGDTRIYLFTTEGSRLLTRDHTYVQDYLDQGNDPDEEFLLRYGSFLTRSLDGGDSQPDLFPVERDFEELSENSCFLLCSDGLILNKGVDNHREIQDAIFSSPDLETAGNSLITNAYEAGSADNISVCLIEIGEIPRKKNQIIHDPVRQVSKAGQRQKGKTWLKSAIVVMAVLVIILVVLLLDSGERMSPGNLIPSDSGGIGVEHPPEILSTMEISGPDPGDMVHEWIPFEKRDFKLPFDDSSKIYWKPYPDTTLLSGYMMRIIKDGRIVDSIRLPHDKVNYRTIDFQYLEGSQEYELEIDALLDNGTRIPGNRVRLKYK